jgi:multiple sugar transport system ATP-binding protein
MAAINLQGVSLGSDPGSGVNLAIGDREFVVVTGPPGCGSSGLLRAIAGLDVNLPGEIQIDGRPVNAVPPKERGVALVSRDFVAYPNLSVRENMQLCLKLRRFGAPEIEKRIREVTELLGLGSFLDARGDRLAPEQRQFLALARAMVQQPKVYLFDEPFAGLPASGQARGRAEIVKLKQRASATIVYATSDPAEALALGDRVVLLDGGDIKQDGSVRQMFDEPANISVARFFGDPPMNLIHGTIKQDRGLLLFAEANDGTIAVALDASRFPGVEKLAGQQIVLGIRPSSVELAQSGGSGRDRERTFRGLIERVEPRGAETDLYLQTGGHELISRSRLWIEDGDGGRRAEFVIDLEKVLLFDPVSGRRVAAGS